MLVVAACVVNDKWPLQWQVSVAGSPVHPSWGQYLSLTSFISVGSCHIGVLLSPLMLGYPCPAHSSLEWCLEDIWLKSSSSHDHFNHELR